MASQLLAILQQGITSQEKHQDRELQRALRQLELGTQVKMQQQKLDFEELEGERERGFTLTRDYLDDLESQLARDIDHEREMDRLEYETQFEKDIQEAEFLHDRETAVFGEKMETSRALSGDRQKIEELVLGEALLTVRQQEAERTASRQAVEAGFTDTIDLLLKEAEKNKHGSIQMLTGSFYLPNLAEEADSYQDTYEKMAKDLGADSSLAQKVFANVVNYQGDPMAGVAGMESLMNEINEMYSMSVENVGMPTAEGDKATANINFLVAIGFLPPGVQQEVKGMVKQKYTALDKEKDRIPKGKKVGDEYDVETVLGQYSKLEAWEKIYGAYKQNKQVQKNVKQEYHERYTPIMIDDEGNAIEDPDTAWRKRFLFETEVSSITPDLSDIQPHLNAARKNQQAIKDLLDSGLNETAGKFETANTLETQAAAQDTKLRDNAYISFSNVRDNSGSMTMLLTAAREYLWMKNWTESEFNKFAKQSVDADTGALNVRGKGDNWVTEYFHPDSRWGQILRDDKFWGHFDDTLQRFGKERGQGDYVYYGGVNLWDWASPDYQKNKVRASFTAAKSFKKQYMAGLPLYEKWMESKKDADDAFNQVFK